MCSLSLVHRDGKFHAKAWMMEESTGGNNIPGWIVRQDREVEVHEGQLLKNFPELSQSFRLYGIPDPANIYGMFFPHHNNLKS